MLQKKKFKKIFFFEKVKMTIKNPFVVESFVTIGSFDNGCSPLQQNI